MMGVPGDKDFLGDTFDCGLDDLGDDGRDTSVPVECVETPSRGCEVRHSGGNWYWTRPSTGRPRSGAAGGVLFNRVCDNGTRQSHVDHNDAPVLHGSEEAVGDRGCDNSGPGWGGSRRVKLPPCEYCERRPTREAFSFQMQCWECDGLFADGHFCSTCRWWLCQGCAGTWARTGITPDAIRACNL